MLLTNPCPICSLPTGFMHSSRFRWSEFQRKFFQEVEVARPSSKRGPKVVRKGPSPSPSGGRKSASFVRGGSEDAQHVLEHFHNATVRGLRGLISAFLFWQPGSTPSYFALLRLQRCSVAQLLGLQSSIFSASRESSIQRGAADSSSVLGDSDVPNVVEESSSGTSMDVPVLLCISDFLFLPGFRRCACCCRYLLQPFNLSRCRRVWREKQTLQLVSLSRRIPERYLSLPFHDCNPCVFPDWRSTGPSSWVGPTGEKAGSLHRLYAATS